MTGGVGRRRRRCRARAAISSQFHHILKFLNSNVKTLHRNLQTRSLPADLVKGMPS